MVDDVNRSSVAEEILSSDEEDDQPRVKKKWCEKGAHQRRFCDAWLQHKDYKQWLQKSSDCSAICKWYNCRLRPKKDALNHHMKTKKHQHSCREFQDLSDIRPVDTTITMMRSNNSVKSAELKITTFIAEHCSTQTVDHLSELIASLFPNNKIVQASSNKMWPLLCPYLCKELLDDMNNSHFSLIIDESTDVGVMKMLALVVHYFSRKKKKIMTTFYRMLHLTASNVESIALAIQEAMQEDGLEMWRLIGIRTDNVNVMLGAHSSIYTKLHEKQVSLVLMPCVCHSLALASSKAVECLPTNLDYMIEQTYAWFARSSKRKEEFEEVLDEAELCSAHSLRSRAS